MASTHYHIDDMGEAIRRGVVPARPEDPTTYVFPTVSTTTSRGGRQTWVVRVRLLGPDGRPTPVLPEYFGPPAPPLPGFAGEIWTESRRLAADGAPGPPRAGALPTFVRAGKNLGKKNATNPLTQALRDAFGLYNKALKSARGAATGTGAETGGPEAPDAAHLGSAAPDAMHLGTAGDPQPPPMLLKRLDSEKGATLTDADFARGITAQRKLDGVRLVAYLGSDDAVHFYSRTASEYPPPSPHITAELGSLLRGPLPEVGTIPDDLPMPADAAAATALLRPYIDGELYVHGRRQAWISGQARREEKDVVLLEFHVFDVFFPGLAAAGVGVPSWARQAYLDDLFAGAAAAAAAHVVRVEDTHVATRAAFDAYYARALADGYEGAILRRDDAEYRYGIKNYHSTNVLKMKPFHDAEFRVVDYAQGTKGKAVGAIIWIAEVPLEDATDPRDRKFRVTQKDMSLDDQRTVFRCLGEVVEPAGPGRPALTRFARDFLGQPLTVTFPDRSEKGKPLQAKARAFRTYEGGPALDPIRRLFDECAARHPQATTDRHPQARSNEVAVDLTDRPDAEGSGPAYPGPQG
jgi:hypothetical protein